MQINKGIAFIKACVAGAVQPRRAGAAFSLPGIVTLTALVTVLFAELNQKAEASVFATESDALPVTPVAYGFSGAESDAAPSLSAYEFRHMPKPKPPAKPEPKQEAKQPAEKTAEKPKEQANKTEQATKPELTVQNEVVSERDMFGGENAPPSQDAYLQAADSAAEGSGGGASSSSSNSSSYAPNKAYTPPVAESGGGSGMAWGIAGGVAALGAVGGGIAMAGGGEDAPAPAPAPVPAPARGPQPDLLMAATLDHQWLLSDGRVMESAALGEKVTMTITVANTGEGVIQGAQLAVSLDSLVGNVLTVGQQGSLNVSADSVVWQVENLAVGEQQQYSFTFRLEDAPSIGQVNFASNIQLTYDRLGTVERQAETPIFANQYLLNSLAEGNGLIIKGTSQSLNPEFSNMDFPGMGSKVISVEQGNQQQLFYIKEGQVFGFAADTLNGFVLDTQSMELLDSVTLHELNMDALQALFADKQIVGISQLGNVTGDSQSEYLVYFLDDNSPEQQISRSVAVVSVEDNDVTAGMSKIDFTSMSKEPIHLEIGSYNSSNVTVVPHTEMSGSNLRSVSGDTHSNLFFNPDSFLSLGDLTGNGYEDMLVAGFRYSFEGESDLRVYETPIGWAFGLYDFVYSGSVEYEILLIEGRHDLQDLDFSNGIAINNSTVVLNFSDIFGSMPESISGHELKVSANIQGLMPAQTISWGQSLHAATTSAAFAQFENDLWQFTDLHQPYIFSVGDILGSGSNYLALRVTNHDAIYVLSGDKLLQNIALADITNNPDQGVVFTASDLNASAEFGFQMVGIGDFNGDGVDDFVISAPFASTNGLTENGVVYVVYGSPDLAGQIDLANLTMDMGIRIDGSEDYANIGLRVSALGDINGDGFADVSISSETAEGSDHYIIFGYDSSHQIDVMGTPGDDILHASDNGDVVFGGPGDDIIYGGAGDDVLNAGSGNDILIAGTGNNTMIGGSGDDTFVFNQSFAANNNIIKDFNAYSSSEQDKIDLSGFAEILNQYDFMPRDKFLNEEEFQAFANASNNDAGVSNIQFEDNSVLITLNTGQAEEHDTVIRLLGVNSLSGDDIIF